MDLRLRHSVPTDDERAAVDALLGPPTSAWDGGARGDLYDAHVAHGGREARERRHLLLPALEALQSRVGWISETGLEYVCVRLNVPPAEAWSVATFYALLSTTPRPRRVLHVCDDIACRCLGAAELIDQIEASVGPAHAHGPNGDHVHVDDAATVWMRSPCLGQCDFATAALLQEAGPLPREEVIRDLSLDEARTILRGGAPSREPKPRRSRAMRARLAVDRADDGDADAAASARFQHDDAVRVARTRQSFAPPRRHDRSDRHRGVHDVRRIRGASPRARDRPRRRDPRDDRLEADGPRRRGVPDRTQMGSGRETVGASALSHLQRRRIRAGHVQGSRAARRRSVRDRRVDDDRRVRDGLRARLPLHSRRVSRRRRALRARDRRVARARLPRQRHPRPRRSVRHRDSPRRGRVHLR